VSELGERVSWRALSLSYLVVLLPQLVELLTTALGKELRHGAGLVATVLVAHLCKGLEIEVERERRIHPRARADLARQRHALLREQEGVEAHALARHRGSYGLGRAEEQRADGDEAVDVLADPLATLVQLGPAKKVVGASGSCAQ